MRQTNHLGLNGISDKNTDIFLGDKYITENFEKIDTRLAVLTGEVPPNDNAAFIGQEYIDTTAKKVYKAVATGTGVSDWVVLN